MRRTFLTERPMSRTWVLLLVAFVLIPRAAWPQGEPLGPEFHVNTYTTDDQSDPAIAVDPASGAFVSMASPGSRWERPW
jgi:hypothetical protein